MHREAAAAGLAHLTDEVAQLGIAVAPVDADAVLDGDLDAHRVAHGLHAVGDQLRMAHQAGADHVVLHPIAGAADVEIHLVVTRDLGELRARRQIARHTATQLQRQRMFALVVTQKPRRIAMQQRAGRHHFGVEQGVLGKLAQEEPAVAVGPVHHRGDGKTAGQGRARGGWL